MDRAFKLGSGYFCNQAVNESIVLLSKFVKKTLILSLKLLFLNNKECKFNVKGFVK